MDESLVNVLQFANENPSSWLATSEDGKPHVRGMLMWFADETGFYFHTAEAKRLYGQIQKNPYVEAAFIRNPTDPVNFETLHVAGTVETVADEALLERLKKERPWLWGNMERAGVNTECVIFRIIKGSAYIWNMKWNIKEREIPKVAF